METVKQLLKAKPRFILISSIIYIVVLGFLKWFIYPDWTTAFYVLGGLFGVYFMDAAEMLFNIKPSPFHSMLFVFLFGIVSFFIITSSNSMFAIGLVFSLFFNIIMEQVAEWKLRGNLTPWYQAVGMDVTPKAQLWFLIGTAAILIFESVMFVR